MPWTIDDHRKSAVEAIGRGLMEGDLKVLAEVPEPAQSAEHQARTMAVSVLERIPTHDIRNFGAGTTDDNLVAVQKAFDAGGAVYIPYTPDGFPIDGQLRINHDGMRIYGEGTIVQIGEYDGTIIADGITDLTLEGFQVYGNGHWTKDWTGVSGHDRERGISLRHCERVKVNNIVLRNNAAVGLSLVGCTDVTVSQPFIEGTHEYSTPLEDGDNNQFGIYVDSREFVNDRITILAPNISGTAQGVYTVDLAGSGSLKILDVDIHDIPGQHGAYLASSQTTLSGKIRGCALDAMKFQAAVDMADVHIPYLTAEDCGGQAVAIAALTGNITNVSIGMLIAVRTSRALTVTAEADQSVMGVTVGTVHGSDLKQYGILTTGEGTISDVVVGQVQVQGCGYDGLRFGNGSRLLFADVVIRDPAGDDRPGYDAGIFTDGAHVRFGSIDVADSENLMRYGLYLSDPSDVVSVTGYARIDGYVDAPVRSDGTIAIWPTTIGGP